VTIRLNAGGKRFSDAIHLKVSAVDVRQASALAERFLKERGDLREGEVFRVAEVMIDLTPIENETPFGAVELQAILPLEVYEPHGGPTREEDPKPDAAK
jgi:hypothetical protein